jgi:hypothetical protein
MRNNGNQAVKIQTNIKNWLHQEGRFEDFQNEMQKTILAGSARWLTSQEIKEWDGPIH